MTDATAGDLEALGLSRTEQAIYAVLVGSLPLDTDQILNLCLPLVAGDEGATDEGVPAADRPAELRAALVRLASAGLVQVLDGASPRYAAAAPDLVLAGLLRDREEQLRVACDHIDELAARHEARSLRASAAVLDVVSGADAVAQRLSHAQSSAQRQLRRLRPSGRHHLTGGLPCQVVCRTIYDRDTVTTSDALSDLEGRGDERQQARVFPTLPVEMYLVDDRLALLSREDAGGEQSLLVLHPGMMLDSVVDLFEGLWRRALPLRPPRAAEERAGEQRVGDRERLLTLLLSGLTDEAIARQLGISARTAQRRVARLMQDLDARTRFQAGAQAALRNLPADRRAH